MGKRIKEPVGAHDVQSVSLSELIHQHVRIAIETAVREELRAALGTTPYERSDGRRGYRNGNNTRTLTGPAGPVPLPLPRATLFAGAKEWTSRIVPRYQRRTPEVNDAIVATYLAGGDTRRIRGASTSPQDAPLSKSAVSRVIATLKDGLAWRKRSLADLDVVYLSSTASPCACAVPDRWSADRYWAQAFSPTGTNICSPESCAASNCLPRGKAASPISSLAAFGHHSSASPMAMPDCGVPWAKRGPRQQCNGVPGTSCAIWSARRRSTRSRRSATMSIPSSTRQAPTPRASPTRDSSARGPSGALAW